MEIPLIIILALVFELITIVARLIFGSAREFFRVRKMIHIDHLYLGIILLFFYQYWYLLEIAIAMIAQDLAHHFILLPLWKGETEFPFPFK